MILVDTKRTHIITADEVISQVSEIVNLHQAQHDHFIECVQLRFFLLSDAEDRARLKIKSFFHQNQNSFFRLANLLDEWCGITNTISGQQARLNDLSLCIITNPLYRGMKLLLASEMRDYAMTMWRIASWRCRIADDADFLPAVVKAAEVHPVIVNALIRHGSGACRIVDDVYFLPGVVKAAEVHPVIVNALIRHTSGACRIVDDVDFLPAVVKAAEVHPVIVNALIRHGSGACRIVDDVHFLPAVVKAAEQHGSVVFALCGHSQGSHAILLAGFCGWCDHNLKRDTKFMSLLRNPNIDRLVAAFHSGQLIFETDANAHGPHLNPKQRHYSSREQKEKPFYCDEENCEKKYSSLTAFAHHKKTKH